MVIGNSSLVSKLIGLRGNIRESNSLNFSAASTTNVKTNDQKTFKVIYVDMVSLFRC